MSRNSVPSPKMYESEELKSLLIKTMKGSAFSVDTYLSDNKVVCHGKYYDYHLSSGGNEILIKGKWSQTWFIGVLVCAITGLFFLIPLIGAIVISVLANSEYGNFKRILKDSLYNGESYKSTNINDSGNDPLEQLQKLADLKEKGLISNEDYEKKKSELLEKVN